MVVVRTQQGWYDRTGSIQYPDIKSVVPWKYVKANKSQHGQSYFQLRGVINRNSIHTGPERDRLLPIKLQLGPGVEIIGGCDTPHTPPLICAPDFGPNLAPRGLSLTRALDNLFPLRLTSTLWSLSLNNRICVRTEDPFTLDNKNSNASQSETFQTDCTC